MLLRKLGRTFRRQQTLQVTTPRRRAPNGQRIPPDAPSVRLANLLAVAIGARSFRTGVAASATAPRDGPVAVVRRRWLPSANTAVVCSASSVPTTT